MLAIRGFSNYKLINPDIARNIRTTAIISRIVFGFFSIISPVSGFL